ncbi:MAG: NADH-quinone oxidoreductase subunit L [Deltaproteobacteria bacterium]|nr:NADH-quinone oxidoreductase subunit L [Deltaproteobacteria bacterium]
MVEATPNDLIRWVPLLPLLGALVHGVLLAFFRTQLSRTLTIALSCGSVVASFLLSLALVNDLTQLAPGARVMSDSLFTWIGTASFTAEAAFLLDPLSAVMILVVTGVGSLIHIYSIGYMDDDHRDDRGFARFFCYLNLFTFSMLMLVLGDNLLVMFLGWEGVGVCSYLLIGFWYSDTWNAYCGSKAFIVNRIGDFGFLLGLFLLFWSLSGEGQAAIAFRDIQAAFPAIAEQTVQLPQWLSFLPGFPEWKLATLIGLCFFVGAAGKSAQLPLYVWLPDAMAGPTPVSALIHAATMVTAGVYMVSRMSFVYAEADGAMAFIAWTGAITALLSATIAIAQTDIKKVLAYSTVSQLGFMFVAAGCGAFGAAMFHVVTHAFFKALLFLGAGSVILAMHHEQDTDKMGGLRTKLPWTHKVFLMGVLAIAGAPFFSGFFSKDEILLAAKLSHVPAHGALYAVMLGTAGITAFYMFRLYFRTFLGKSRASEQTLSHVHEPAWTVVAPLVVLALASIFGGFLGPAAALNPLLGILNIAPENSNSFANFVAPVLSNAHHEITLSEERLLAVYSVLVAGVGVALAALMYVWRPAIPVAIRGALGPLHRAVENKYYVDEIYDALFVKPLVWLSKNVLHRFFDAGVIDGVLVNGSAATVRGVTSGLLKYAQSGFAQSYLGWMALGTACLLVWLATQVA